MPGSPKARTLTPPFTPSTVTPLLVDLLAILALVAQRTVQHQHLVVAALAGRLRDVQWCPVEFAVGVRSAVFGDQFVAPPSELGVGHRVLARLDICASG